LALQRLSAEIRSTIAANEASIARASQRAEEIELSKLSLISDFNDEVSKEISRVNSELAQYEQAMVATRDVVTRTDIRAPVDGTVFNLRVKTVGGVVAAGDPILEIVPHEDTLIVEARLSPSDIDMVASGQPARVHLTPFAARHMAPLEGHLLHISSDVLIDTATHASYYELRIAVDADHMASRPDSVALTPGMPAEVYIMTGEQSLFSYLAAPLTRSFRRALREE
jgi:HlyD family secretion protein